MWCRHDCVIRCGAGCNQDRVPDLLLGYSERGGIEVEGNVRKSRWITSILVSMTLPAFALGASVELAFIQCLRAMAPMRPRPALARLSEMVAMADGTLVSQKSLPAWDELINRMNTPTGSLFPYVIRNANTGKKIGGNTAFETAAETIGFGKVYPSKVTIRVKQ